MAFGPGVSMAAPVRPASWPSRVVRCSARLSGPLWCATLAHLAGSLDLREGAMSTLAVAPERSARRPYPSNAPGLVGQAQSGLSNAAAGGLADSIGPGRLLFSLGCGMLVIALRTVGSPRPEKPSRIGSSPEVAGQIVTQ